MNWTVYLLECGDGTFYCGCTVNLALRLQTHIEGRGARYTRGRTPLRVIKSKSGMTRSEALKMEAKIKKLPKKSKLSSLLW